ncbi:hypothetical protein B0H16DRAFT_89923 [Mycena metata]|uniref:C2H2-type domain-containing protein n=1 Tax=Mycena metata TaxID=1033252 RepID=A0AAD7ICE8_9AGAR|nr:hypothetical protein B0H16DRAFT_89923 [Mycena metata]
MSMSLPLSPSPSPSADQLLFAHGHPSNPHAMHPSLAYHSASSSSHNGYNNYEYASSSSYPGPNRSESPPDFSQSALDFGALEYLPNGAQGGAQGQGQGKRYRAAPPKTFQCSGYGECRMVFSRSEHLARHIRKHTGERPFACHCAKQFSRLDNLRQHAQTVHSAPEDKPLNERMMRALAGVNASMMAGVRSRRSRFPSSTNPNSQSDSPSDSSSPTSASPYASPLPSPGFAPPGFGGALPSPPYSAFHGHGHGHSAEYALSAYDGSPLPSPSFGAFPGPSQSPYASPAYDVSAATDYLSAGHLHHQQRQHQQAQQGVRVKQEDVDVELELAISGGGKGLEEMEGFYKALGVESSSSSASSSSSSSGSSSQSQSPSPAGSPCVPSFWASAAAPGRQHLPSPPQSPGYYVPSSASSSHSRPSHPQAQAQQQEWWTIEQEPEEGQEMSNAEYYARAAASAHPHRYSQGQSQSQYTPSQSHPSSPYAQEGGGGGYFGHGYRAHAQGPYAVFA